MLSPPERMIQLFISHSSEDKQEFVRPLANALRGYGLDIWYDEFSLKPGDSLRRSIDQGLARCTAGIVVLSPSFFAKEWPQRELDALFTAEIAGRARIIPIWFKVDFAAVAAASPLLADRLAIHAELGTRHVAAKIAEQFPTPNIYSGSQLAEAIENCQSYHLYAGEAFYAGCRHRFLQINAFKEAYAEIFSGATSGLTDEQIEEFPPEIDRMLDQEEERLRLKFRIPRDVYLTTDEPVREQHLESYLNDIGEWSSGTLTRERSSELVKDLDLEELDEYFILLEIPSAAIGSEQRSLVNKALVELGCGFEDGFSEVNAICDRLRQLDNDT